MSSTIKNYQFTIPIKPDTQVGLPQNFNNRIARQYASMYLEKIGAVPDDENIDTVLENHPLNKCGVSTSLKTRGWMEDLITINTSPFNRSMTEDDFPDKPDKKLYNYLLFIYSPYKLPPSTPKSERKSNNEDDDNYIV